MHSTIVRTRLLPSLVLFAFFVASCTPATATASSGDEMSPPVVIQPTTFPSPVPTLDQGQSMPDVTDAPTEIPAPTPFPVATSRGPDLHATDPTTVDLASGQLQFVEFFRFT